MDHRFGTGKTGRRVAARLRGLGETVKVGSRRGPIPFDWDDEAGWSAALDGADSAYITFYPDISFPGASERIATLVRAARAGGVGRLVLLSGRGEPEAVAAEDAVRESGATWTVLRSAWFAQNFSEYFLLEPVLEGQIALPAGDVAEPFLDLDDLADVAAAALTRDGHAGRTYELTGPRLLTFADAAAELTRATGRRIDYRPLTPDQYARAAIGAGVPAEEVGPLTDLFGRVLDGHNAYLTDDVERVLGREPRDFADYARSSAASGVWNPAARAGDIR
ncbi:NmrA family transcriptional regulator [Pseudactinotalea sp. HY160]|nr:NmrA family transcriptional regulator [Pseudactinotalea sp. HY160]QGH71009.1 NmrA family transcriptional regulator [Pseudactinotalea sp. HY158]